MLAFDPAAYPNQFVLPNSGVTVYWKVLTDTAEMQLAVKATTTGGEQQQQEEEGGLGRV